MVNVLMGRLDNLKPRDSNKNVNVLNRHGARVKRQTLTPFDHSGL